METMNELKLILKRKNIQLLVDFCLDESLEFTFKPQTFPDTDWELTMKITDIKTAVAAGMFLRENRIDVNGIDQQKYKKQAAPKKAKDDADDRADEKEEKSEASAPESNTIF
ncbi:MAG TPA: hypothetical protein VHO90_15920 [Bacteroidales bacterium]|nr:hypothetical protein [Bacteroidales bacterium]